MRWKGRRQSTNVEDRRGGGNSGGSRRGRGGKIGIGTIVLAALVYFLGGDPLAVIQNQGPVSAPTTTAPISNEQSDELAAFVKVVLADNEDVWTKLFPEQLGRNYKKPVLVLFEGQVRSACGAASSATGPFYCPGDDKIYIDLSFYNELSNRLGAGGDFAMAYVVAHEVGHHIQNILGISGQVQSQRGRIPETEQNKLSVRLELQADFLAGVWAHHAHKMKNILESGDIEEAMNAAHAIGDDRLQKQARGYVVPDSFTHGTSKQRMRWFKKGLESGNLNEGDTFKIPYSQL